jgi:hypothetical protein
MKKNLNGYADIFIVATIVFVIAFLLSPDLHSSLLYAIAAVYTYSGSHLKSTETVLKFCNFSQFLGLLILIIATIHLFFPLASSPALGWPLWIVGILMQVLAVLVKVTQKIDDTFQYIKKITEN